MHIELSHSFTSNSSGRTNLIQFILISRHVRCECAGITIVFIPLLCSILFESTSVNTTARATLLLGQTFFILAFNSRILPNESKYIFPASYSTVSLHPLIVISIGVGHSSRQICSSQSISIVGFSNKTRIPSPSSYSMLSLTYTVPVQVPTCFTENSNVAPGFEMFFASSSNRSSN